MGVEVESYIRRNKRRTIREQVYAIIAENNRLGVSTPESLHKHYGQDIGRSVTEMAKVAETQRLETLKATKKAEAAAAAEQPKPEVIAPAPERPRKEVRKERASKAPKVQKVGGSRACQNDGVIADLARKHKEVDAAMVAEHFQITVEAARVRLWRAAGRGAIKDVNGDRKKYKAV